MRDAVEGCSAIPLQYYVLIDMQGFAQLIDALGGVEITVDERLPIGSNNYDDGRKAPPAGYIEAATQRMDGQTALWYARTRYATTDYARMARQRQVQEAILAQASPGNVLANFTAIAQAGAQVVRTDIPQPMLEPLRDPGRQSQAAADRVARLRAAGLRQPASRLRGRAGEGAGAAAPPSPAP